jgi:TonB family protein
VYTHDTGGALIKTRGGGVIIVPGVRSGATKWTYSATVLMYKKPLPDEVLWGVDAERTMALLKPYVASDGKIPPPSRDDLFRKAFLAHAQISMGDDATAAPDDAAPAASTGGGPPPDIRIRTVDSIVDTMAATRLIPLHAIYRAYVTHLSALDTTGEVVLEFSITPNGQVRGCRVTSSSIKDRAFSDAVATLVGQTEFGPANVSTTRVRHFRISFAELPQGII